MVEVLSSQGLILGLDFLLELGNLMLGNLELAVQLGNIVLSFKQVLRIEILLRSDSFIQVLLLLQLGFELNIFLLKLGKKVLFELNFLDHLLEMSVVLLRLLLMGVTFLGDVLDRLKQLLDVLLVLVVLLKGGLDRLFLLDDFAAVLAVSLRNLAQRSLDDIAITDELHEVSLFDIGLLSEPFNLTCESTHSVLGGILLHNGFLLVSVHIGTFVLHLAILARKSLDFLVLLPALLLFQGQLGRLLFLLNLLLIESGLLSDQFFSQLCVFTVLISD